MSEEENPDKPEDVLPVGAPLAVAISLAGEEFVDDASVDAPELSKEQLETLLAGVREGFGETSGVTAPASEDVLTLAILEGSATPEQLEEHDKLLQDDEYRNSFEEREGTHSLLAEALPAAFHGETEIEAPPLAEGKKEELLAGVRERFEQEEIVEEESLTLPPEYLGCPIDWQALLDQVALHLPSLPRIVAELTNEAGRLEILGREDILKIESAESEEVKEGSFFGMKDMWKHFMGVAAFSRLLAKTLDKCDPELAYRCGEMHDVGKIVQFRLNEDLFRKDANEALDRRLDYGAVERANRRPPHDFLGYLVCRKWGFSSNVEDVARWHHENDPEKRAGVSSGKAHDLIDLVILANWITQVEEFGFAGHRSPVRPPKDLLTRLGTSSSKLESLRETVIKEFSKETFAPVPTDRSFVRDLARVSLEREIIPPPAAIATVTSPSGLKLGGVKKKPKLKLGGSGGLPKGKLSAGITRPPMPPGSLHPGEFDS